MSKSLKLNNSVVPNHVSIIMDGNGRWAENQGLDRIQGHKAGIKSVRESIEAALMSGVKYLSLYAFSEENWGRPQEEIDNLMSLMLSCVYSEYESLMKNGVRFHVLGNMERLPSNLRESIGVLEDKTKDNNKLNLIIFLSYSGRWDIVNAIKNIVKDYDKKDLSIEDITPQLVDKYLVTSGFPDPDLIIRTSGEQRLSNFLLWQSSYTEFVFLDENWPCFNKDSFKKALDIFANRHRRFGKIG